MRKCERGEERSAQADGLGMMSVVELSDAASLLCC